MVFEMDVVGIVLVLVLTVVVWPFLAFHLSHFTEAMYTRWSILESEEVEGRRRPLQ